MSLFNFCEWYTNDFPTASCMVVENLVANRDQIIVGAEDGTVSIIDPGATEKSEESLLLQKSTDKCAIQILIGEFLSIPGKTIAILSTNTLTYYRFKYDSNDLALTELQEMFSHPLAEPAYNMCLVVNNQSGTSQILVQSVSCGLTLFQGDQCIFSRSPLPALHPGPIAYNIPSASVLIASGARLHSAKFSLIASLSNSGKKVTFDWICNLGDVALQLAMDDGPPVQPSVLVLCRRSVFCFTTGGNLRWQIRLDCVATTFFVYRSGLTIPSTRFGVVVNTNTLLIYADNVLLWNCQTNFLPIAVGIGSFSATHQYLLSFLSFEGRVCIGYLGTEPSLYRVVDMDNQIIDYGVKLQEIKALEENIKDSAGPMPLTTTTSNLQMTFKIGDIDKSGIGSRSDAPSCTVTVQYGGVGTTERVFLNVRSSFSHQIMKHSNKETIIEFTVDSNSAWPPSTNVQLVAVTADSQATCVATITLPIRLLFFETSPERNAKYKITLDTDRPAASLVSVFPEFETENPSSIALFLYGSNSTVSIYSGNKSNRYRIQTDDASLLYVIIHEMTVRLKKLENDINIHGNVPLEIVTPILDSHLQLEDRSQSLKDEITRISREVREIEIVIVNKLRNTKTENLVPLDMLMEKAHDQLIKAVDQQRTTRQSLIDSNKTLMSFFHVIALLMSNPDAETTINGYFYCDTNQSLKDRLAWAAGFSGDPLRMLGALCRQATKTLTHIVEEEGEEEGFDETAENS